MHRALIVALAAASLLPAAAQAQSQGDYQRDRGAPQDRQDPNRDPRQAGDQGQRQGDGRHGGYQNSGYQNGGYRNGQQGDNRPGDDRNGQRGDYRQGGYDDHRGGPGGPGGPGDDRGRAWGHDDWRGWRDHNPGAYGRGNWRAPFRYTPFRVGGRIAPGYYGNQYVIADPWRYHLPPARPYSRWVRHYDDVLLVDYRRSIVLDVIRGFYR